MKILVLSCNTGGGHNACARYITEEFKDHNITCEFVDYMTFLGKNASLKAEKLYLQTLKGNGNMFKIVYKLGEIYNSIGWQSPIYQFNKKAKDNLWQYIQDNNYNLCISTHVFPSMCLTEIKKSHKISFVNVATDYECIPFWNETIADLFIIPSESLKKRFITKGIKENTLVPLGIPVASNFYCQSKLKFNTDKKIVLLFSGSMGFGQMEKVVLNIVENVNCYLVVVCGSNKKLKEKLEKLNNENLKVYGFVNNMNEFINSADIVVAKPGGLSITEITNFYKPLVIMMPIPGVEDYNAKFFTDRNMALNAKNVVDVSNCVNKLLQTEQLRNSLMDNQKKYMHRNSAKSLVEYIEQWVMENE